MIKSIKADAEGVALAIKMSPADIERVRDIATLLVLPSDPPTPGCKCQRCMRISIVATAVKIIPPEELNKMVAEYTAEQERIIREMTDASATMDEVRKQATAFLNKLHGILLPKVKQFSETKAQA